MTKRLFSSLAAASVLWLCGPDAGAQTIRKLAQNPPRAKTLPPAEPQTRLGDPVGPRSATFEGETYYNRYFGLRFNTPQKWTLVETAAVKGFVEEGRKVAAGDDEKLGKALGASAERTINLLTISKHPIGSTQPFNATFSCMAELVPSAIIKTGPDYLDTMLRTFARTQVKMEPQGPIRTQQIGGASFGVLTAKLTAPVGVFMQKYVVTVRKGYALVLVYTYFDEGDLQTFDDIVKSVEVR